jgi:hypothetical protein
VHEVRDLYSLQMFKTYFAPVRYFKRVTLEIHTELYVGFHVKCQLCLSDFNQNSNTSTHFIKDPEKEVL